MLAELDAACASKVPPQGPWGRMLERTNRPAVSRSSFTATRPRSAPSTSRTRSSSSSPSSSQRAPRSRTPPSSRDRARAPGVPTSFSSTCRSRRHLRPRAPPPCRSSVLLRFSSFPHCPGRSPERAVKGPVCPPCALFIAEKPAESRPRHRRGAPRTAKTRAPAHRVRGGRRGRLVRRAHPRDGASRGVRRRVQDVAAREPAHCAQGLAHLPIVRGLDRFETALGEMPPTFDRTGEQAR